MLRQYGEQMPLATQRLSAIGYGHASPLFLMGVFEFGRHWKTDKFKPRFCALIHNCQAVMAFISH